jgi:prephenate dehydrogenase
MAGSHRLRKIAIVGVGLIGGSIGMAARRRKLADQVIGIGRRESSLRTAKRRGAVTATTTDLAEGVAEADLIVVCTPVEAIVDAVQQVAASCPPRALITDAGSTKAEIVAALERGLPRSAHYVGSHPMAGSEQNGPQHASEDLLVGRTVIMTPTRQTSGADRSRLRRFWESLGARVVELTPREHDRRIATVSHLPHLVAATLAASATPADLEYVASGWLDTTRIAAGDVDLWEQIVRTNSAHVLKSLSRFETLLNSVREAIAEGDYRRLRKILKEAKRKRDAAVGPTS